ncbi:hypothetical protein [Alistipes sp. ZOR0009]|uniref:hypothetical protein n=1 Tax=Alistipes sp. ZOR0009 TaxID=1339253 RepID=UPI000AF33223|nr:hypothetical protein [Alistipes sp. ZOR0009]
MPDRHTKREIRVTAVLLGNTACPSLLGVLHLLKQQGLTRFFSRRPLDYSS